jgi:hypothetical protein
MARNGLKILDSDMHVFEPHDLYLKYMNPNWGKRVSFVGSATTISLFHGLPACRFPLASCYRLFHGYRRT